MQRSITFWRAWALVVGTMVGSGVFLLPSVLGRYGWHGLWGWGITATGAIVVALTIAWLSHRSPGLGGPYAYTKQAFGKLPAFFIAWGYWVSLWIGNAAIAVAFSGYAANLHPLLATSELYIALGVVTVFTLVNWLGIATAGFVGLLFTVAKVVPLLLIGVMGIMLGSTDTVAQVDVVSESGSYIAAVASMAMLALWAFTGLEAVTIPSDDVEDPKKTLPKALITGVASAAALYVVATFGVMMVVSTDQLATSGAPFADAAQVLFGDMGGLLVGLGALIAIAGTLNALIMMSGQMAMAAAEDNMFPSVFAIKSKRGVPAAGIAISTLLSYLCIYFNFASTESFNITAIFEELILLSTLLILAPYLACTGSAIKFAMLERNYKTLWVFIPSLIFVAFATFGNELDVLAKGAGLMLLGLPVYLLSRRVRGQQVVENI